MVKLCASFSARNTPAVPHNVTLRYAVSRSVLVFGLCALGSFCYSVPEFSNAINTSSWRAKSSPLSCRLEHDIPSYGNVLFQTRAGEVSSFLVRSKSPMFGAGEAAVMATSPVWVAEKKEYLLAEVKMKKGRRPLWLGTKETERMLSSLRRGMQLTILGKTWRDAASGAPAKISIVPIGFQQHYSRYQRCLAGLISHNYDQLKRTSLRIPEKTSTELSSPLSKKLDAVLELMKHDKKINTIYIDGHTDSDGDRESNLQKSKIYAELVASYLIGRGTPKETIIVRWHGERYPAVSNTTSSGRAKNRRVTLRLEKERPKEVASQ